MPSVCYRYDNILPFTRRETNEVSNEEGTSTSTSTTTTAYTVPGVSCWETLKQCYCDSIGAQASAQIIWYMSDCMRTWGIEAAVIQEAIIETGFAPHPSPHYLRAILERCKRQQIRSLDQWLDAQYARSDRLRAAAEARNARWCENPSNDNELPF